MAVCSWGRGALYTRLAAIIVLALLFAEVRSVRVEETRFHF